MGRGRSIDRVRAQMEPLARLSGGRSFAISRINDLDEVLTRIRQDLENRYLLGYEPLNGAADGTWRSIEVRTANRRHVVEAREGYAAVAVVLSQCPCAPPAAERGRPDRPRFGGTDRLETFRRLLQAGEAPARLWPGLGD